MSCSKAPCLETSSSSSSAVPDSDSLSSPSAWPLFRREVPPELCKFRRGASACCRRPSPHNLQFAASLIIEPSFSSRCPRHAIRRRRRASCFCSPSLLSSMLALAIAALAVRPQVARQGLERSAVALVRKSSPPPHLAAPAAGLATACCHATNLGEAVVARRPLNLQVKPVNFL